MNKRSTFKIKTTWAIIASVCSFVFCLQILANQFNKSRILLLQTNVADTIPFLTDASKNIKDTINNFKKSVLADTSIVKIDSIRKIDTLTISKDSLDAPIKYEASDSGVLIIPTKEFYLYGKAKVSNKDVNLDAATIKYSQTLQTVQAYGVADSTGNPYSKPKLVQGETKTISDSIAFNLKSLKGLTKNTYLQDGEMYINAKLLKKVDKADYYGYDARFTTCNLDTPHFAFRARRIKLVTNKLAVTGPTHPEIEGIPIPIGIPFGIFPLAQGRHSGVLPPAFAESESYGLGLEGLGYYKAVSYTHLTLPTKA